MDPSDLKVLQAASRVLNEERRPDRECVNVLTEYAEVNLPERVDLPPDELATVVAMKLMDISGDPEDFVSA